MKTMDVICYCPVCRNRSKKIWKDRIRAAGYCLFPALVIAAVYFWYFATP